MRAITLIPKRKDSHRLEDVQKPRMRDTHVLVRTIRTGLDGTDKELLEGLYGKPPHGTKRLIPGHESLGIIEGIGQRTQGFRIGDLVTPLVRRPDTCINCRAGEPDMCLTGTYTERGISGMHGFLTEYYTEKPKYLVKIPKTLVEVGVLAEPMSIAQKTLRTARAVQKRMVWKPKRALVTGTGTLGLLTAFVLRLEGFSVVSVDRSDKPNKARIFNRTQIRHFNTRKIPVSKLPEHVGGRFDLIVEATGSSAAMIDALHTLNANGVAILTSITGDEKTMEVPISKLNHEIVLENKTIVGIVNAHHRDFESGIRDLRRIEKRWPGLLESLIEARYPIERFDEAIAAMDTAIKVTVEFGGKL